MLINYDARYQELLDHQSEFHLVYSNDSLKAFAAEQISRFLGSSGTMKGALSGHPQSSDRQVFLNVLGRPLIETYFWMEYIFDGADCASWQIKYDEYLVSFKQEYTKLYNEPELPDKHLLQAPHAGWNKPTGSKDLKSVIAQVRNDKGDRLDYLYFVYRVASFDVHGKAVKSLLEGIFPTAAVFPVLEYNNILGLIADSYDLLWKKIK